MSLAVVGLAVVAFLCIPRPDSRRTVRPLAPRRSTYAELAIQQVEDPDSELYEPWPCAHCGTEVKFPHVVCQKTGCQAKQREAEYQDARMRNFVDMGRGASEL